MRQAAERLSLYVGQTVGYDSIPTESIFPRIGWAWMPGCTFFFLLGATTAPIVGGAVLGWIEGRRQRNAAGIIRSCDAVAEHALFGAPEGARPFANRIIIAGYSYGGACGLGLAYQLRSIEPSRVISVVSFGSPKAGDDRAELAFRQIDNCRWMNAGDNVPYCPPTSFEAIILHRLLATSESVSVDDLTQVRVGKLLAVDGTITDAAYPANPGRFTDLSLAAFLVSNESPTAINHSLAEYVRRFGQWQINNPPAQVRERASAQPVPPVTSEEPAVNPATPAAQMPLKPFPSDLPPRPPRPVRVGNPYLTVHNGRLWVVQFQGSTVYVGRSKRDAKIFAARMNSAYHHWNAAPAGDADGLAESVHQVFRP